MNSPEPSKLAFGAPPPMDPRIDESDVAFRSFQREHRHGHDCRVLSTWTCRRGCGLTSIHRCGARVCPGDETLDLGVRGGAANPGRKVMTMLSAMALGADCIEDCDVLRSGQTAVVLGHRVAAPSTLGTFCGRSRSGMSVSLIGCSARASSGRALSVNVR